MAELELLTIETLSTNVGAILAVTAITGVLKGIFTKVNPRIISLIVALLVMIGVCIATSSLSFTNVMLAVINGVLVSNAANGSFDNVLRMKEGSNNGKDT